MKLIGQPKIMKIATERGLTHPLLMRFVLKMLANLTDPTGGAAMDRIINGLSRSPRAPDDLTPGREAGGRAARRAPAGFSDVDDLHRGSAGEIPGSLAQGRNVRRVRCDE
ncbi:hypothetical protein GCM10023324_30780 [Streptomyces youssoufiensis]